MEETLRLKPPFSLHRYRPEEGGALFGVATSLDLIQFCRITDPPGLGSRTNLSMNYLLQEISWHLAGERPHIVARQERPTPSSRWGRGSRPISTSMRHRRLSGSAARKRSASRDLDAPVFSFFPEYDDLRTPEKDHITLRHLLTMSSGFAWDENSVAFSDPSNSDALAARIVAALAEAGYRILPTKGRENAAPRL